MIIIVMFLIFSYLIYSNKHYGQLIWLVFVILAVPSGKVVLLNYPIFTLFFSFYSYDLIIQITRDREGKFKDKKIRKNTVKIFLMLMLF